MSYSNRFSRFNVLNPPVVLEARKEGRKKEGKERKGKERKVSK